MFRSFCITCRPRDGISDSTIEGILKWLHRHPNYACAVLEKTAEERHLHAQLWYDEPKYKGDITKQLKRICISTIPDWDPAQTKVLASGTKVAYNDWYLNYLYENDLKESPNIILDKPPSCTDSYYPSEEEQDRVQRVAKASDPRFQSLEEGFRASRLDSTTTPTLEDIARYLYRSMFCDRSIRVVTQQRDRTALALSLYHYMLQAPEGQEDTNLFITQSAEERRMDRNIERFIRDNEILSDSSTILSSDSI